MTLTGRLWAGIEQTYAEILRHPFFAGLTDGSLPADAFAHYIVQDARYLGDYARALAALAARADATTEVEIFARHASGAIVVERSLHESLLPQLGIDAAAVDAAEMLPTTLAYTSYLRAVVATGSYPEALGAVLPCYWIYREVGTELLERGSPDKRYQMWIDTYGGEEFAAVVREALDAADRLESRLSSYDEERMHAAFRTTSRYEWMFWDAAWRRETWPV